MCSTLQAPFKCPMFQCIYNEIIQVIEGGVEDILHDITQYMFLPFYF